MSKIGYVTSSSPEQVTIEIDGLEILEKNVPHRIAILKNEILNSTDLNKTQQLRIALWRFENAKVFNDSFIHSGPVLLKNEINATSEFTSIEPIDKKPFEISSEVDLKEYVASNVERCIKNIEINMNNETAVQYYRELKWRFENVIVINN